MVIGLWPVASTTSPPAMNAITVVMTGTMMPLAPRRNAVRAAGEVTAAPSLCAASASSSSSSAHGATSAASVVPPIIAMPSCSSLASGGNSPTIVPS